MSTTNPLNNATTSVTSTGTTSSGTKIITASESGGSMDKNSFLKILAAELSNLDPSQNQDSTAYVTQMAQFGSIEQMSNLNDTMTKSSYQQLVGKGVTVNDTDSKGVYYSGVVKGVTTDSSGTTYLSLLVSDDGSGSAGYKTFPASDLKSVVDSSESANSALSDTALNTDFLTASQLKGQDVELSTTNSSGTKTDVTGTVKSVFIDNGVVKIRVTDKDGNTNEYPYSSIVKAGDLQTASNDSSTSTTA